MSKKTFFLLSTILLLEEINERFPADLTLLTEINDADQCGVK